MAVTTVLEEYKRLHGVSGQWFTYLVEKKDEMVVPLLQDLLKNPNAPGSEKEYALSVLKNWKGRSMRANNFNIEMAGDAIMIKKTRQAFVSDLAWFAIFMVAMAVIIGLLYLYVSINVNPLHVFLFGMLFLFMCILYL